jgi:predicted kinase
VIRETASGPLAGRAARRQVPPTSRQIPPSPNRFDLATTAQPLCSFARRNGLEERAQNACRMSFFVVVRGPLGIGKSTVSKSLATKINAEYISIDQLLDDHGLWVSGRLSEFLRANDFAVERAHNFLERGVPVIFDGNFYWKTQLEDLLHRLEYRHFVFTLEAPLEVCAARDGGRASPHGATAARQVYAKSTRFEYGIGVDATRRVDLVVRELARYLSPNVSGPTSEPRAACTNHRLRE